jgi:Flp pilus assembly pilin Flp
MKKKIKNFLYSQKGINTVEVVIILAIVVGLALLFRKQLVSFATGIMDSIFNNTNVDYSPWSISGQSPSPTP